MIFLQRRPSAAWLTTETSQYPRSPSNRSRWSGPSEEAPQRRSKQTRPLELPTQTLPHTLPRTGNFAARLETQRALSCSCQRRQPGKSSQPGKKLNHPAKKPVHSKVRKKGGKKNIYRSSNAGQGEAAEVDFLLAYPGAPGRGARRRRAGQRGAVAGSGRGAPVPPAPAGSMNESAWK